MTIQSPTKTQLAQDPDIIETSRKSRKRVLWLLILAIPACLWLISQAALFGLGADQVDDAVLSSMNADYSKWGFQPVNPLKPELIGTIRSDQATMIAGAKVLGTIVPFIPLGTRVYVAEIPSATPTTSPTNNPTPTPTPTHTPIIYWPVWTLTPSPTATLWPEVTSVTSTSVPPDNPPVIPPPSVQFSGTAYSVNEYADNAAITVTLTAPSAQTVTVTYATSDGTAISPADYTSITNTLTFLPGQVTQTFNVPIIDDALDGTDETFQVTLTNPTNATLGTPNPSVVTILDDDAAPSIQFLTTSYVVNEGDAANLQVVVTVTLSTPSGTTLNVDYATGNITATASFDYQSADGRLTFTPGQTSRTFIVTIINDTIGPEGNESLSLTLSNPLNATIGTNNPAVLTIIDEDPVPVPSCGGVSGTYTLGDPAALALSAVDNTSLDVGCGQAIVVDLGATPITANVDFDFDLAIYERQNGTTGTIEMDWVIVQVGASSTGPWLTVFYWGDGGPDSNTSLGRNGFTAAEADNEPIPMTNPPLMTAPWAPVWVTGIGIDIDAMVPAGTYQWLRIFTPNGGTNDPSQVDYIQIITP